MFLMMVVASSVRPLEISHLGDSGRMVQDNRAKSMGAVQTTRRIFQSFRRYARPEQSLGNLNKEC